jgi:hypothetical protein
MRASKITWGTTIISLALVSATWGQEQISGKLKMTRVEGRMAMPRLSMPVEEDKQESRVQIVTKKSVSSSDGSNKRQLRTELREQKTKRVVAAQN